MEYGQVRRRKEQREKESLDRHARTGYLKDALATSPSHRWHFSVDGAPPADILPIHSTYWWRRNKRILILQAQARDARRSPTLTSQLPMITHLRVLESGQFGIPLSPTLETVVRGYPILGVNVSAFQWAV